MNYLVIEGYKDAAEKFQQECGTSPGIDLRSISDRMATRVAIQNGDVQSAIERANDLNPLILDENPQLYFHLQQQKLIELIRSGDIKAALQFAEEELRAARRGRTRASSQSSSAPWPSSPSRTCPSAPSRTSSSRHSARRLRASSTPPSSPPSARTRTPSSPPSSSSSCGRRSSSRTTSTSRKSRPEGRPAAAAQLALTRVARVALFFVCEGREGKFAAGLKGAVFEFRRESFLACVISVVTGRDGMCCGTEQPENTHPGLVTYFLGGAV